MQLQTCARTPTKRYNYQLRVDDDDVGSSVHACSQFNWEWQLIVGGTQNLSAALCDALSAQWYPWCVGSCQCYICLSIYPDPLFSQALAVIYKGWLSFILLLSACIIWIVPKSRTACLYSSPLIVVYAIVLILIQYVYGLNLTEDELPQQNLRRGFKLADLGITRWRNSVVALIVQVSWYQW